MSKSAYSTKFNIRSAIQSANKVRLCYVVIGTRDDHIPLSSIHALKIMENYLEQSWTGERIDYEWGTDAWEWKCPTTGNIIAEYINYDNAHSVFNIYANK